MKQQKIQTKSKHIRLPVQIIEVLEEEAAKYGYTFNEWTKFLLTDRVMDIAGSNNKTYESLEKEILEAKRLSKEGKLPSLKTHKEIDDFFDKLLNEDL